MKKIFTQTRLTAIELAAILKVSESTVKKLADTGEIPCRIDRGIYSFFTEDMFTHFEKLERGVA